jgi:hypothetical protein
MAQQLDYVRRWGLPTSSYCGDEHPLDDSPLPSTGYFARHSALAAAILYFVNLMLSAASVSLDRCPRTSPMLTPSPGLMALRGTRRPAPGEHRLGPLIFTTAQ